MSSMDCTTTCHQTDLRIAEHYTDTASATDHVFGLCHLLGFRFAPRIKDLKDRKLYAIEKAGTYPLLEPLIGDTVKTAAVVSQWAGLMRLKASIQAGTIMPSVILRKLGAAGAGNNTLSRALRALGRIERTLFTLQWLSCPELGQRSHAGLNKGEASNSLRRAVFFHRQGEIRDRTLRESELSGIRLAPRVRRPGSNRPALHRRPGYPPSLYTPLTFAHLADA
jgi:TnpA family transposase